MKIDKLKSLFNFLTNEYQLGNINGSEFTDLFNKCQLDYFEFLVGPVEQFQPGRPVPRVAAGMGEAVGTKLSRFVKPLNVAVVNGVATKPSDFYRFLSSQDNLGNDIRRAEYNKIGAAVRSAIIPIATNPRFVEYGTYWNIYPSTVTAISGNYYRLPTAVLWDYVEMDGREIFSESNSVDPEWSDVDNLHILGRMIRSFGVPIKDAELMQYGESIKQTGE